MDLSLWIVFVTYFYVAVVGLIFGWTKIKCLIGFHTKCVPISLWDYDCYFNKLITRSYSRECCYCGHVATYKPGDREWDQYYEEVAEQIKTDPSFIRNRGQILLKAGFEVDLATGEPVDYPFHTVRIEARIDDRVS